MRGLGGCWARAYGRPDEGRAPAGAPVAHQVLSRLGQHASMRWNLRPRTATRAREQTPRADPVAPTTRTSGLTSRCEHSQKGPCMRHGTQHADLATAELETALRGGPFHIALRAAIAARGLPLQRVQHHLSRYGVKVGVTSLSYWQQGARRPQRPESLRAVRALEEILQLPDESLIRLLAKADEHPVPERPAGRSYRALVEASGVLEQLLAELESPLDSGLHTLGHHECVRIGAHRELMGRESHHIVRAHKEGVDRYMAIHHGDPGCARSGWRSAPWRTAVRGACVGTGTPEYSWPSCSSTRGCARATRTSSATASTTGRPGCPASTCADSASRAGSTPSSAVRRGDAARALPPVHPALGGGPRSGRQELTLSGHHRSVHLVEPRVRSGIVGIGWDWE